MVKDLKDFEDKIDALDISPLDCDTLLKMLNNMSPEMFAKAMEEIVDGDLKISDFADILADTQYSEFLKTNIPAQYNLKRQITAYNKLLNNVYGVDLNNLFFDTMLGIDGDYISRYIESHLNDPDPDKVNKVREFYDDELSELKKDIIYSLSLDNKNDSILQIACKNSILNDLLATEDKQPNALQAADLLFSIEDYILPVSPQFQVITDADKYFMNKNNVSEDMMKKIKAIAMFLRREYIKVENESGDA